MRRTSRGIGSVIATAAAITMATAACSDSHPDTNPDAGVVPVGTADGGDEGGVQPDAGDGTAPKLDGGGGGLMPPAPVGLAVVGSNYMATTVSLVSATGMLVQDGCVTSDSGPSGQLSLTLSGDVTTPSQPQLGNDLWLIDRGNTALTVVDPATCRIDRQFSVGTGFKANPHDVVVVSQAKAYVTRFEKNLLPTTANSGGDDVLIIDPQSGAVLGRVDLSPYAAPVDGATIQARPDRAVMAGGRVVVTLASQDANFATVGEGRLVIIDPTVDRVAGLVSLTGLKGCSEMDVLPGTSMVYVACGGSFADADQALESGVALVDVGASPPAVTQVVAAQAIGSSPINFSWVVAVTPTRMFVGTLGALGDATTGTSDVPDAVFAVDPTTGHATQIAGAPPFDLGRSSGGGGRLFVPDATPSAPRLHVFDDAAGTTPTESAAFDPEPAGHLQPREVAWY